MLIDRWLEYGPKHWRACAGAVDFIGTHRRLPERFEFTDETTRMAAALVRDYPDLLVRNYQFATPPYPSTYIEYNSLAWAEEYGLAKYGHLATDDRVGHLIHNETVGTVVEGKGAELTYPGVCPWTYTLSEDAHVRILSLVRKHKMHLLRWGNHMDEATLAVTLFFGPTTVHHPRVNMTDAIADDINRRTKLWVEHSVTDQNVEALVKSFSGEMKCLWQLLLMIHQPKHIHFDEVAASRSFVGGKPTAQPRYRLVRIKPKVTVHHISRTMRERAGPGLHKVRDFWRNFDKDEHCTHEWPLLPNEIGQYHCSKCPQWRVSVRTHERGDPTRPVVRKGYKV